MTTERSAYIEVHQGEDKQWYWSLKAANHQIVAVGGEGFSSKSSCLGSIEAVKRAITDIRIETEDE